MRLEADGSQAKANAPKVAIASRQSDLARIQAYLVADALRRAHPNLEVSHHFRESLGDQNQHDPLWQMPERGVFTNDFLAALIAGETDLVVHSWKDLPVEERAETEIVATLGRADARDVLLVKRATWQRVEETKQLRVFSSSPRRARNLDGFLRTHLPVPLESVEFVSVRGNVPTRVRKLLEDPSIDGLIVAKAALDRLLDTSLETNLSIPEAERAVFGATARGLRKNIAQCRWVVLPLAENPTAAAQGALAIEIRRDRSDLREILSAIHCEKTARTVRKERAILKSYGGGCHQKIGITVLPRAYGELEFLRGETDAGENLDAVPVEATPEPAPSFFIREDLPFQAEEFSEKIKGHGLWISRSVALPASAQFDHDQIVWCAGPETWRKLSARGIWVHGSAESLGEEENPEIEALTGAPVSWLRLTHSGIPGMPLDPSEGRRAGFVSLPTYRLVKKTEVPKLDPRAEHFWMSGSNFMAALEHYPELKTAKHYCGPGKTASFIKSVLGSEGRVEIQIRRRNGAPGSRAGE